MITLKKNDNLTITHKTGYYCLLALIWSRRTFFVFVVQIINRLPIIGLISNWIYPILILISTLVALPYMAKFIKGEDLIGFFIGLFLLVSSMIVHQGHAIYLEQEIFNIISLMLFFFIGISFNVNEIKEILFWVSLIGVISSLLYQFYSIASGRELLSDNLGAAYNVLPSMMYIIYYAFIQKKTRYWFLVGACFILIFSFGSRGPILCMISFFLIGLYVVLMRARSGYYQVIYLLIACLIIGLLYTNILPNIIEKISAFFRDMGLSTRVFEYFLAGDIANDSGRNELQQKVWQALLDKPIFGYGIMGDRVILNGTYVHNIILEVLCNFGFVLGTGLLLALVILLIKAVNKSQTTSELLFILMMISMVIIKLMLSGAYVVEQWFYFMLGLAVCYTRKMKEGKKSTK